MDHITAHHRNALYFAETNTAPRPHLVRPTRQPNHMLATEVLAWSRSSGNPTRPVSMGWTMAQPPKNKVPQSCCSLGGHREKNLGSTRANARSGERARARTRTRARGAAGRENDSRRGRAQNYTEFLCVIKSCFFCFINSILLRLRSKADPDL